MVGQVVLDSTNLDAIVRDATGEGLVPVELPTESGVQATIDAAKADLKPAAEVKADAATDDMEDENGLTPRQKRELTAKMLAAVGKKHRQAKEAEEFAAEQYNTRRLAEQRADGLERELARERQAKVPEPEKPTEPDRAKFATDAEYQSALIDWKVDQRLEAQRQKDFEAAEAKRQAQILAEASARIAKAIEIVPDFVEATEAVDWPTPPAVAGYMQESELFAELGYYLATHPQARSKLDGMNPARQLVEIGKIESTLKPFAPAAKVNGATAPTKDGATPSTETVNEPQAPEPNPRPSAPVIRPLTSVGAAQVEKPASQRTYEEEKRAFQKRHHVNLTRRSRH